MDRLRAENHIGPSPAKRAPCTAMLLRLLVAAGMSFATGCAFAANPVPGDPLTGSGIVSRTANSYNSLIVSTQPTTLTNESNWGLPTTAAAPTDTFEGTLTLTPIAAGYFSVYYDLNNLTNHGKNITGYNTLPAFSFQFVQNGSYLIPVTQGWFVTGGSYWNYIIGVGRAWSETTDNGYTRASIPFALVQVGQNCLHNGTMTFVFNKNASPKISHVAYQIDAEGCPTFQFDMAGQLAATYTPATVPNDTAIENAEAAEVTNRMPVKPFTALATDFPSSGINTSAFLAQYTYPNSVTTYGVVINGTNYNSGCATRHTSSTSPSKPNGLGYYPYCSEMRMPSYSTAKSAFASLAMMRLGQLYGSGVYSQDISAWVPQYIDGGIWTNVTFGNASDMATGNYISSGYEVDEDSSTTTTFLNALSYASKISDAITPLPHKVAPGTTWVYQSVASFIETQAENAYLKAQQGSTADLFARMSADVYTPLLMSQGFQVTERTDNAQTPSTSGPITGAPAGYFGLFYNIDDMAKLGNFINAGTGVIGGQQVIDANRLKDALYRTSNPGLTVPCAVTTCNSSNLYDWHFVYNHNFWGKVVTNAEYSTIHCTTYPTIPFMSGYGGITIMMLPNGATYYVQSDAYEFWIDAAITQLATLAPICS